MSNLEDLLKDTNNNFIKGWAFNEADDHEGFKLLKLATGI